MKLGYADHLPRKDQNNSYSQMEGQNELFERPHRLGASQPLDLALK